VDLAHLVLEKCPHPCGLSSRSWVARDWLPSGSGLQPPHPCSLGPEMIMTEPFWLLLLQSPVLKEKRESLTSMVAISAGERRKERLP
jgi:hypothetical protein